MSEKLLQFGGEPPLTGMAHLPDRRRADGGLDGALLLNAGIVHRIGPHRMNVKLARRLGAVGLASLRFDFPGLGDSPARAGADPASYEDQYAGDVVAAGDCLAAQLNIAGDAARFAAIGLCSGADNAYRAALRDPRIKKIILLDPYAYENPKARLERLAEKARDMDRWRRAASRFARRLGAAAADAPSPADAPAQDIRVEDDRLIAPPELFGADLQRLTTRGVEILILYTNYVEELLTRPAHFFDTFRDFDFGGRLTVEFDRDTDHTYTTLDAQDRLFARVERFLAGAHHG